MMRNPIERAWSQTVMSFDKVEKGSFSSVSEEELFKRIGRNSTYKLSNYLRTFENWGVLPGGAFLRGVPRGQPFSPCGALAQHVFLPWRRSLVRSSAHGEEDPRQVRGHDADEGRRAPGAQLREEISRLEERFGGYASFWLYCADRLIESPPEEEEMTYPLFESSFWEEWAVGPGSPTGLGSRQVQSGPLASIQVAT